MYLSITFERLALIHRRPFGCRAEPRRDEVATVELSWTSGVLNDPRRRITKAIKRLRNNFDEVIRIEDLADELGMSESSFDNHFKAVTHMTPLQFQKQLRLQEARG